jgi:uncharacterized protein YebE (UPF0316 family)
MSFLPVLVFIAETTVVTLSTVRTIFIARGKKLPAACLGFFEVSIWLFAISQIMNNLNRLDCYFAFACGFSLGNYLGVYIEQKLALGNVVVNITTRKDPRDLVDGLKSAQYGVTLLPAQGATGPVQVVLTVIKRKDLPHVEALIKRFDEKAFYAVNDLQTAAQGIRPASRNRIKAAVPILPLLGRSA